MRRAADSLWRTRCTPRRNIAVSLSRQQHDASTTRPYVYQRLQANDIRLLDLHPSRDDASPIQCTLRTVALTDKPRYESLSYCWGVKKVDDEEEIPCDNGTMRVTRNLFGALQHLQHPEATRTLWIDALCICQTDITERGQQVGMMRDIFQLSERTVVWLGPAAQNSPRAIQLIRQLAQLSEKNAASTTWAPHLASHLPPLYDTAWRALAALLKREWWHRAWIVQEVSVAKDIMLVCGDDAFSWDALERAVQYAVDLGFFFVYGGSATFQAFSLFQTRANFLAKRRPCVHDVLLQHRSFRATDRRDKVFGMLALADQDDVVAMGIRPDYHRSANELFGAISRSLLAQTGLALFKAAGVHDKSSESGLPTWVADWSVSDPAVLLNTSVFVDDRGGSTHKVSQPPRFDAARSSTPPAPVFGPGNKTLQLQGILVDEIEAVGVLSRTRYLRHVSHMFQLFVQCYDILNQLKDWETTARIQSHVLYPTGESRLDAYWHTLCAGRVPPHLPSARHDARYKYYVLLRTLRRPVRLALRWLFPRSSENTWLNRFFYRLFQSAWRLLGLTPTKIQRLGFPPESRLPNHRRMARTQKGYLVLAPRLTRRGDCVVVCKGGQLPLVVRRDGRGLWVLVGECYVHGIMYGEAWDERLCRDMWFR
ncbi:HET-domain-containing protein [Decorospora gaudefroyi]|uniref:HET-domain-containing protein n=1 Tax=Decorospora gaudefroyi TaxID=184978 RepID=A0A6A5KH87_9PLEO|nr:HET-domain-containing protein [Decorospora gaudefroyi]